MKKSVCIFLVIVSLIFCTKKLSAQKSKVEWKEDTIKVDSKPYAIMLKKKAGAMRYDFVVSSLSGTELLYFKSQLRDWTGSGFRFGADELYYEANFIATESRAELSHYTGSGFAELLVSNNLIKENAIDPESEKRFIHLNHGYTPSTSHFEPPPSTPAVVVNINNNGSPTENKPAETPVAAKSKSPVTISGSQILRDETVIGKFRQDTTTSSYSQKTIVIVVYSEGGEKVATATAPFNNPQEWNIKTVSDNRTFTILYDAPGEREKLFKWLADKNYLSN